jgi:hypothetical protein
MIKYFAACDRLKTAGIQHKTSGRVARSCTKNGLAQEEYSWKGKCSSPHRAEVADQDLRAQERQDKKLRATTPECVLEEDEEVQVLATPEQQPPVSAAPAWP